MILDKVISVRIPNPNISYYRNLGYFINKVGDVIDVDILHIPHKSSFKINAMCDICNVKKDVIYNAYNRYTLKSPDKKYRCHKCSIELKKKTCKEKYGDENYTNRKKYKETLDYRYGGHFNKLNSFKDKIKEKNKKIYGVEYPMQNNFVKDKQLKTIREKYNVENNIFENYIINQKRKKTMVNKYGNEYSMQVKTISDKIVKSSNKTKINYILSNDKNIIDIDYEKNLYNCWCDRCNNTYIIKPNVYRTRKKYNTFLCTNCNSIRDKFSGVETEIANFIKNNYNGNIINNSRNIIEGYELDIYLPEINLAIEFNGIYWHSELYKENNYHINKTNICKNNNITLIHIWEDDWYYKNEIIKSIILSKIKKTNRIFARKCEIKEILDNSIIRDFLEKNHIQGFLGSNVKIGLYYNNELVSLMIFGNLRKNLGQKSVEGSWELLRFCNKLNISVIGGPSKMLNCFTKKYNPFEIISYADLSISDGNLYKKLDFIKEYETKPNYYWIINGKRVNRFSFRKDVLVKLGEDPSKTEKEIMYNKGYYRLFDCGSIKFIKKLKN